MKVASLFCAMLLTFQGLADTVQLWDGGVVPASAELEATDGMSFYVIKEYEPEVDGYSFLHGVALCWHKERLYSSFGHNKGAENTASEEARGRYSDDGGATWSDVFTISPGYESLAVSHGVFLSEEGTLWSFNGAFTNDFQQTHTRAYTLNETTEEWVPQGVVVADGFWPMQKPLKMDDGNWIMSGMRADKGLPVTGDLPAVAISHGDDLTQWDLVVIPCDPSVSVSSVWGESTVIVEGSNICNISRWGGSAIALASFSTDYGRTWTPTRASNIPMTTSKPYTGMLSTGQRYLVCTTTSDSGSKRYPLTIAVSEPGESFFSKIFLIRHALFPEGLGESDAGAALSYPYAVENNGKLYVGYSNNGDRTGNINSAEMAVIPVAFLDAHNKSATFSAVDDTFIYNDPAWLTANWGVRADMVVGLNYVDKPYRGLLCFDLSSLRTNCSDVKSAEVILTVTSTDKVTPALGDFDVKLFLLNDANSDWVQGTKNAGVAGPGEPCWNYREYDTDGWSGGPGVGSSASSVGIRTLLDSVSVDVDDIAVGSTLTFTVDSPEGLSALNDWTQGDPNPGFLLTTDETSAGRNALFFGTQENSTTINRPKLTIVYTEEAEEFAPVDDTFIYNGDETWRNANWGVYPLLVAGLNSSNAIYRTLLRFDPGVLDMGSRSIRGATLTLTQADNSKIISANGDFTVSLYLLNDVDADWVQGTKYATAAGTGEPCWNWRQVPGTAWNGGAGIGNSTNSSSIATLLDSITVDVSEISAGDTLTFAIDNQEGLSALEQWARGETNAGFLLATDETSPGKNALMFASAENVNVARRPSLRIITAAKPVIGTRLFVK